MDELIEEINNKIFVKDNKEYDSSLLEKILKFIKSSRLKLIDLFKSKNTDKENFSIKQIALNLNNYQNDLFEIGKNIQFTYLLNSTENPIKEIRNTSLEIILSLLCEHKDNQYLFLKEMNLTPLGNVVYINWFPDKLLKALQDGIDSKILKDIQIKSRKINLEEYYLIQYNTINQSTNYNNASECEYLLINDDFYTYYGNGAVILNDGYYYCMWPPNYRSYIKWNLPDCNSYLIGIYLVQEIDSIEDRKLFKETNYVIDYSNIIKKLY